MCQITNRAFERNPYEADIRFSLFSKPEKQRDAMMYNASEGGLYFESDRKVKPGSDIFIKIRDNAEDAYSAYRCEVMWCRKKSNGNAVTYGIGARFLLNICDHCGDRINYRDICKTNDYLILCPSCDARRKSWACESVGSVLERYLIGNVL